jgi:hypothetical protein
VSRGTWAAEMKTPDGKTMPISGHWLIVGACQGGQGGSSCLISQHVGNTNMPPPQQASAK